MTPLSITVSATPVSMVDPAKAGWRGITATVPSVSTLLLLSARSSLSLLIFLKSLFIFTCIKPMGVCMDPGPWAGVGHLLALSSPFFPSCERERPIFLPARQEMETHGSVGVAVAAGGGHTEGSDQCLLSCLITDTFRRADK